MRQQILGWFVTMALMAPTITQGAEIIIWDNVILETGGTVVPDGFQGFDFHNWFGEFCPDDDDPGSPGCSGQINLFRNTSGSIIGDYASGDFAMKRSDGGLFDLLFLFATNGNCGPIDGDSPPCNAGSVAAQGFRDGVLLFGRDYGFDPWNPDPVFLLLNFRGIDEFRVWNSAAEIVWVDGVTYRKVNEPATLALLALGFASLRFSRRRINK